MSSSAEKPGATVVVLQLKQDFSLIFESQFLYSQQFHYYFQSKALRNQWQIKKKKKKKKNLLNV